VIISGRSCLWFSLRSRRAFKRWWLGSAHGLAAWKMTVRLRAETTVTRKWIAARGPATVD
jgi:hypothetical protein